MAVPTDWLFQPVDPGEVAGRLLACVEEGSSGYVPEFGGPEVRPMGDLARIWVQIRGKKRWIVRTPTFGRVAGSLRRGDNTVPEHAEGKITWREWLARTNVAKPR